jgi:hypothetical protein
MLWTPKISLFSRFFAFFRSVVFAKKKPFSLVVFFESSGRGIFKGGDYWAFCGGSRVMRPGWLVRCTWQEVAQNVAGRLEYAMKLYG